MSHRYQYWSVGHENMWHCNSKEANSLHKKNAYQIERVNNQAIKDAKVLEKASDSEASLEDFIVLIDAIETFPQFFPWNNASVKRRLAYSMT